MKAENLYRLQENGFPVPNFTVVKQGEKVNMEFSKAALFAVRSSYDGEDGAEHSYAGQFKTLLNVPAAEVSAAVETVWKSMKTAAESGVQAYENAKGINGAKPADLSGLVIVQEMVEAEYAGVVFTANPMGLLNEMVLVAGCGLGDGVVEEKTEAATYYYHKEDKLLYGENTEHVKGLARDVILQLAQLCEKAEQLFGQPMDLEYAVRGEKIYLLQARPITTLPAGQEIVLDNSNIVESYPGVSLPLTISFVQEIYYKVFKSCLRRLTGSNKTVEKLDASLQHMVDVANGRIYYRISNWYDVLLLLPFSGKIIPVWQEMLGVEHKQVSSVWKKKVGFFSKAGVAVNFVNLFLTCPGRMKKLNRYFEEKLPAYRASIDGTAEGEELLTLYEELLADLSGKWDITLANDMYTFIYTALAKKRSGESLSAVSQLESMKPVQALKEVWEMGQRSGWDSEACQKAQREYIALYGDRCLEELKLETRTYRTDPEALTAYLKSQTREDFDLMGKTQPVRNTFWVRRAQIGIRNREISRMNRSRIFGMAREIMLKIGAWLVQDGLIEEVRDVFYLYKEELKTAVTEHREYRGIVAERKQLFEGYTQLPDYSRLVFKGEIFQKAPMATGNWDEAQKVSELHGTPCCRGKVTAPALVITEASDLIDTTGKILVTKSTDPGWVLLIHKAAGIISEKGSLLSHTAIITRELGKPSVVGIPQATRYIHTGDMITLDGDTGEVHILQDRPSTFPGR